MKRVIVILTALALAHSLSAEQPPAARRISNLRSVTYYKFGTKLQELNIELFNRDIAHAKEIGLNGMWLVVTWRSLSPTALPEPKLNDAAWKKLDAMINALSQKGLSIIFPLGYFGRGWSPKGIPDKRVSEWILDEVIWKAFEDHVVRLTRRYADHANILWMFYTESFQGPLSAYENLALAKKSFRSYCHRTNPNIEHWNKRWGSDYISFDQIGMSDGRVKRGAARWEDHFRWMCSVLRSRYGALARKMKREVGVQGLIGYHDNAMITKNWAKGDTPIPENCPYDFLSFTAYIGKGTVETSLKNVEKIYRRFKSRYPDMPLMIGETGVATLVRGESVQADYLSKIAHFAQTNSLGMNIWMWQDFRGSNKQQRSYGLLRLDGSDKPAVEALRKILTRVVK